MSRKGSQRETLALKSLGTLWLRLWEMTRYSRAYTIPMQPTTNQSPELNEAALKSNFRTRSHRTDWTDSQHRVAKCAALSCGRARCKGGNACTDSVSFFVRAMRTRGSVKADLVNMHAIQHNREEWLLCWKLHSPDSHSAPWLQGIRIQGMKFNNGTSGFSKCPGFAGRNRSRTETFRSETRSALWETQKEWNSSSSEQT